MDTKERARIATAAATRARRMTKWRRWAAEMRENGWSVAEPGTQPGIPDYIRLSGNEDCGVDLLCYQNSCDPYHHGSVAYYGGPTAVRASFSTKDVGGFLAFIQAHVAQHEAAK